MCVGPVAPSQGPLSAALPLFAVGGRWGWLSGRADVCKNPGGGAWIFAFLRADSVSPVPHLEMLVVVVGACGLHPFQVL